MSSKEVDKLFETLDVDKDGNLDYSEFTGLYTSTNKQLDHLLSLKGINCCLLYHGQHPLQL